MRENFVEGDTIFCEYDSIDELTDAAIRRRNTGGFPVERGMPDERAGGSFDDAVRLAREGWETHLDETLELVESAISLVEKEHLVDTFQAVWDVTGSEVDVARYLNGEPENMIDYPLTQTSKLGKVITLCASKACSFSINADTVKRRGQVIAAFAIMLTRLGHSCELWIDQTVNGRGGKNFSMKALVQGPNDTTDIGKILYAYAHPAIHRRLIFAIENGLPETWFDKACGLGRGIPASPVKNLPEGTIYLPELRSNSDVPEAAEMLKDLLRQAGLLREEG